MKTLEDRRSAIGGERGRAHRNLPCQDPLQSPESSRQKQRILCQGKRTLQRTLIGVEDSTNLHPVLLGDVSNTRSLKQTGGFFQEPPEFVGILPGDIQNPIR